VSRTAGAIEDRTRPHSRTPARCRERPSVTEDWTAAIEYTATNETTLGSFLRLPALDHEALNRAAGDHGARSRVTGRFTRKEDVQW
jgi:hypothetical protein